VRGQDDADDDEVYEPYAPLANEIATSPRPLGDIRRSLLCHVRPAASPAKAVAWEEARIREYLSEVETEAELHRAEAAAPAASDLTKGIAESFDDRVHRARMLLDSLARDPTWQALKE